jgi:predicted nucleotidyltransferase
VTRTAGVGAPGFSASCAFADIDRDGDVDLYVASCVDARRDNNLFCGDAAKARRIYCHPLNFMPLADVIYRNDGDGTLTDISRDAGVAAARGNGLGVVFGDYDNDGDLDLAVANGHVLSTPGELYPGSREEQRNLLFRNDGAPRLLEVGGESGPGFALERVSRTLAAGDIDNDGDLDLLVTNNGGAVDLLRNGGAPGTHALLLRLVGTRSNRDGIGARVRPTIGGTTRIREVKAGSSYLGQHDVRVHVGAGRAIRIDRLEIRWPAGGVDTIENVPVDERLTIVEGMGVSARAPLAGR